MTVNVFFVMSYFQCHIRHLNPSKVHPERITKAGKKMINDLDYEGIKFL